MPGNPFIENGEIDGGRRVLKPSQLNALIKELIENAFPAIWIEGEISNLSQPQSGHLYFTLKDAGAQIRCAMFKSKALYLKFRPKDGQHALAKARVGFYEPRGEFQLVVEHLEEAGEGALRRQFELLKRKLEEEGLFATARKKPLPALPHEIAVITSPRGAAVRDIIAVVGRRFPLARIDILPVAVQGDQVAVDVIRALAAVNRTNRHHLILIARGGGSLEDLWGFNDENLARAVAASNIPVVSAIGHETDFTLIDFVADLRAPTPSAAAELIVPDQSKLSERMQQWLQLIDKAHRRAFERRAQTLDKSYAQLLGLHPKARLDALATSIRTVARQLASAVNHSIAQRRHRLQILALGLQPRTLLQSIDFRKTEILANSSAIEKNTQEKLRLLQTRLAHLARTLHSLSPLSTLERGYCVLRDENLSLLKSAMQIKPSQVAYIDFVDGQIKARITLI